MLISILKQPARLPTTSQTVKQLICSFNIWIALLSPALCQQASLDENKQAEGTVQSKTDENGWKPFLPTEGLGAWEVTDFYKHGDVRTADGVLVLEEGSPLTGITLKAKTSFPTTNFEIELEARRTKGSDFLCGLTFPVGKEFCSFIAGGWGGGLIGLSSIDGADASENSTTTYHEFKNNEWYKFRVLVEDDFIRCWVNDEEVIVQERENHKFSTRIEVHASQPLGLCVFASRVEVKNFRWRPIDFQKVSDPLETSK